MRLFQIMIPTPTPFQMPNNSPTIDFIYDQDAMTFSIAKDWVSFYNNINIDGFGFAIQTAILLIIIMMGIGLLIMSLSKKE
jgi:hypothetical protein